MPIKANHQHSSQFPKRTKPKLQFSLWYLLLFAWAFERDDLFSRFCLSFINSSMQSLMILNFFQIVVAYSTLSFHFTKCLERIILSFVWINGPWFQNWSTVNGPWCRFFSFCRLSPAIYACEGSFRFYLSAISVWNIRQSMLFPFAPADLCTIVFFPNFTPHHDSPSFFFFSANSYAHCIASFIHHNFLTFCCPFFFLLFFLHRIHNHHIIIVVVEAFFCLLFIRSS